MLMPFKDREEVVQCALRTLESLQGLLQQLAELRDELQANGQLPILIQHCKADLNRFEAKIGKVRTLPSDKMIRKAWKAFKSLLGSEGLMQIGHSLQAHIAVLGVQLGIFQK